MVPFRLEFFPGGDAWVEYVQMMEEDGTISKGDKCVASTYKVNCGRGGPEHRLLEGRTKTWTEGG